jgi:hypothetical protein
MTTTILSCRRQLIVFPPFQESGCETQWVEIEKQKKKKGKESETEGEIESI